MTRITVHTDGVDRGGHVDVDVADDSVGYLIVTSGWSGTEGGTAAAQLDPGQLPGLVPSDARALAAVLTAQAAEAER